MEFIVFFFKIVEVSLSIVFTYVQAKLNEPTENVHLSCLLYFLQ